MRRSLLLFVLLVVTVVALVLLSNVLMLGEQLNRVTHWPYAEYVLYALLLVPLVRLVVVPAVRLWRAPVLPPLRRAEQADDDELRRFGLLLADHCDYLTAGGVREAHARQLRRRVALALDGSQLREVVEAEVRLRIEGDDAQIEGAPRGVVGMDRRIRQWAQAAFMATALSPSSRVDALSVVVLDYQMLCSLVQATGFRPSGRQLVRLYWHIATTALLSFVVSEALTGTSDLVPFGAMGAAGGTPVGGSAAADGLGTDGGGAWADGSIDDDSPWAAEGASADGSDLTDGGLGGDIGAGMVDGAGDAMDTASAGDALTADGSDHAFSWAGLLSRFRIPGFIAGPLMDGTVNALLTLRVGYVARAYLLDGIDAYRGRSHRAARQAMKLRAVRDAMAAVPAVVAAGSAGIGRGVARGMSAFFSMPDWVKYVRRR